MSVRNRAIPTFLAAVVALGATGCGSAVVGSPNDPADVTATTGATGSLRAQPSSAGSGATAGEGASTRGPGGGDAGGGNPVGSATSTTGPGGTASVPAPTPGPGTTTAPTPGPGTTTAPSGPGGTASTWDPGTTTPGTGPAPSDGTSLTSANPSADPSGSPTQPTPRATATAAGGGFDCAVRVERAGGAPHLVTVTGPSTLTEVWVQLRWDSGSIAGVVPMSAGSGARFVPGIPASARVQAFVFPDSTLSAVACAS